MIFLASITDWLTVSATIACAITSTVAMIVMLANKSQKREVSLSREYVERREYEEARTARDAQIKDIVTEMKKNREDSDRQQSQRAAGIYRQIDQIRVELKGDIEGMRTDVNAQVNNLLTAVGHLEGKLDR